MSFTPSSPMSSFRLAAVIVLFGASASIAQTASRRALTQDDWDRWRSIAGTTVSADGAWVAYSLVPQVGDGELVVRATRSDVEWHVPRGFIGRPQLIAGFQGSDSANAPVSPAFTRDGRWVVTQTALPRGEYEAARRRAPRTAPKNGLAIVSVADGQVATVARVRSFKVPREGPSVVAYLLEPDDSTASRSGAGRDSSRVGQSAATPGGKLRPGRESPSHGP